jgi:hypothetical protein
MNATGTAVKTEVFHLLGKWECSAFGGAPIFLIRDTERRDEFPSGEWGLPAEFGTAWHNLEWARLLNGRRFSDV